jgi:hypothetical protein
MSLVTLKRKALAQNYHRIPNPTHKSPNGFSLNGTHRNQGYIGQTSLSRSLPRTLMKGSTPRGHGGCCGKYEITPIVQSGVTSLEDSSVVKTSSLNTSGLISTKYRWVRRPQPHATVKPFVKTSSYSDYLTYIRQKVLTAKRPGDTVLCNEDNDEIIEISDANKCTRTDRNQPPYMCSSSKTVKSDKHTGAITGNEYIYKLIKKCTPIDEFKPSRNTMGAPFSCQLLT